MREWFTDRQRVDSMRGLACLLLVYYHAVEAFAQYTGQDFPTLQAINLVLADMRMPLFSFISGLIFAYRPERSGRLKFIAGKSQRLLIPFFFMTALMLGMKTVYPSASVPATIADLPYHIVYAYSHLWFLQAIFLVFCLFAALHAALAISRWHYLLVFGLSLATYFSPLTLIDALSIGGAFYLLPFFTLGAIVTIYLDRIVANYRPLMIASALLFVAALGLSIGGVGFEFVGLAVGVSFLLTIYLLFPRVAPLYKLGSYSYTIYLFHSIFIALGLRLVPKGVGIGLPLVVMLALLAPVVVDWLIERLTPRLRFAVGKGFN